VRIIGYDCEPQKNDEIHLMDAQLARKEEATADTQNGNASCEK